MNRLLLAIVTFVSLGSSAGAEPLVPLAPEARQLVERKIRLARTRADLVQIGKLRGLQPEVYGATRAGRPEVGRELAALGPGALWPMMEMLAVSGYPQPLSPLEREALVVGLLEAMGTIRDPDAAPTLRAVLDAPSATPATRRSAARALGALCRDEDVRSLSDRARGGDARSIAALEGLGACRSETAMRALTNGLEAARTDEQATAAARGLAGAGSSWAREASGTGGADQRATEALVAAYPLWSDRAQKEIKVALATIADPRTERLIRTAAASSDPATRTELETLSSDLRRQMAR
jgi:hypothetical protein